MNKYIACISICAGLIFGIIACKDDDDNVPPPVVDNSCYPPAISAILVKKCATAGCHNANDKGAASNLDLSTWEAMFAGNSNGAVTIPYRADQSMLFSFINTDSTLGLVQQPNMPYSPYGNTPLSHDEIITIRDWINAGAPNCNGFVKFSDDPSRKKFYVANQGCDLVGVHDAETKVVMRYIDVGNSPVIESPHMVKQSPDGQYWYVSFINSNVLQKYRTSDDVKVGEAVIGLGGWNTFTISSDGTEAWVVDFNNGRVAYVNLTNMTLAKMYPSIFSLPHGSMISADGNTLYITGQVGNVIHKGDVSDPMFPDFEDIIINTSGGATADPHELAYSPDGTKYFITCTGRNEVRVFDALTDAYITAIPTGINPFEMSFSPIHGYLFVTCATSDEVTVIDYTNLTAIKNITIGNQPHGIAVDVDKNQVYVTNRNIDNSIPPHHSSACAGKIGYITIIDMSTLEKVPGFKMELSVDPYSVSVRK